MDDLCPNSNRRAQDHVRPIDQRYLRSFDLDSVSFSAPAQYRHVGSIKDRPLIPEAPRSNLAFPISSIGHPVCCYRAARTGVEFGRIDCAIYAPLLDIISRRRKRGEFYPGATFFQALNCGAILKIWS